MAAQEASKGAKNSGIASALRRVPEDVRLTDIFKPYQPV
jgi:hypothetical protein